MKASVFSFVVLGALIGCGGGGGGGSSSSGGGSGTLKLEVFDKTSNLVVSESTSRKATPAEDGEWIADTMAARWSQISDTGHYLAVVTGPKGTGYYGTFAQNVIEAKQFTAVATPFDVKSGQVADDVADPGLSGNILFRFDQRPVP